MSIDYATGENRLSAEASPGGSNGEGQGSSRGEDLGDANGTYILNVNSQKFHLPSCPGAKDISEANRQEYTGSRSALMEQGYQPCGACKP